VVAACTGAFLVAACSGTAPSDSAPPSGPSASPTSVEARLATAIDQELSPGRDSYSQVRAVLVLVNGRTAFERYYQSSPEQYRNVFSVTKSVMSTLVGIAVGEGRLHLDDTLAELPEVCREDVARGGAHDLAAGVDDDRGIRG
jgi:CubicO group peptidase (beta-lactamase class C family)